MAISWGSWEYSGGNGMRVGIEVDWEDVSNTEASADATVKIYTENQYSYSDSQVLTYGGHLDDNQEGRTSKSFTNNSGGEQVLRDTLTYRYTYSSTSYGSSPGDRTFTASISGAFNGVTPSKSVTSAIPARPYAAPAAPSSASITRLSDTQQRVNWVNNATSGKPYTNILVGRAVGAGAWADYAWAGVTTQYTDSATVANTYYQYRVRAYNSVGNSVDTYAGLIFTSPAAPTISKTLTDVTNGKRISWTNNVGYSQYETVVVGYKDGVDQGAVAIVAAGTTSFDHLSTSNAQGKLYTTANKWKYYTYARTTSGALLYSPASGWTDETAGTILPPLAPTNLAPNGIVVDPTVARTFTWTHNADPSAVTAQTKYRVRHRQQGAAEWVETSIVTSSTASYSLPANTYTSGTSVEWAVQTWGAHADPGPYSASAVYQNTSASAKVPIIVDRYTGEQEMNIGLFAVPTGTIMMWPTATPPVGWLVCNGGTFDAAAYPLLNTLLGGNTLPDLRDRAPVGVSATKAIRTTGGSTALPTHSHAVSITSGANSVNHTHTMTTLLKTNAAAGTGAADNAGDSVVQGATSGRFNGGQSGQTDFANATHTHAVTGNTAAAGDAAVTSTQNPYVALNFIIRT